MWISRKKWDALNKRIAEIESRHAGYTDRDFFTVYDPDAMKYDYWRYADRQHISVKDVVQHLLTRAGMKLVYVEGKPAKVDITNAASEPLTKE
jgi:hypothetical protein